MLHPMEHIRNCGTMAWVDLLVMLLALATAVAALVVGALSKSKGATLGVALAAITLSLLVGVVGLLGTKMGERMTDNALSGDGIDPSQKELIRAEGQKEAAECTTLGLAEMGLPMLLSLGALAMAFFKKSAVDS